MTELLCKVCDREIFENESELNKYLTTFRKTFDRSLYKKYTINNINLNDIDKILDDYITIHNKKFNFYFINCEFVIESDNNFIAKNETNYRYNDDITNLKSYLLYYIDCYESRGYKIYNINQMTINIISDRCNMTYEKYINQPMSMCERKINMNIARNPQLVNLLDRNENHPLIGKYSHFPNIRI